MQKLLCSLSESLGWINKITVWISLLWHGTASTTNPGASRLAAPLAVAPAWFLNFFDFTEGLCLGKKKNLKYMITPIFLPPFVRHNSIETKKNDLTFTVYTQV